MTPQLDLTAPPAPMREVDLGQGVVATLRPWSGLLACTLDAQLALDSERIRSGDLSPWSLDASELDLLQQPDVTAGLSVLLATAARAALRVAAWNVVDQDGEPVPANRYVLARLFSAGVTGASGPEHLQAWLDVEVG